MRDKRKLYAEGVVQLDPMDCGSSIAYAVVRGRRGHLTGDLDLSDCNRKIHWYFDRTDLPKIDRVINILTEFRAAFAKATRRGKK